MSESAYNSPLPLRRFTDSCCSSPARSIGGRSTGRGGANGSDSDGENDLLAVEVPGPPDQTVMSGWLKFRDHKKWKQRWGVITKLSPAAVFGIIFFAALVAFAAAKWGDEVMVDWPACVANTSGEYIQFADESECSHFYSCDWRNAIRHPCPPDNQTPNWNGFLVYNPIVEVCDHRPAAEAAGNVCL